jgi:hypothetical protein
MMKWFEFTNNFMIAMKFNRFDETDIFNVIMYIMFITTVAINVLRLIYEINLKFQIFVHLVSILHHTINLGLIVLVMI